MGFFFAYHIYDMDLDEEVIEGDLVRCFNWQYHGETALVLKVIGESCLVYLLEDRQKKTFHKSLLSLYKRVPRDKPES